MRPDQQLKPRASLDGCARLCGMRAIECLQTANRHNEQPSWDSEHWWFSPIIENGGSTPTKNMRISAQAAFDPSRADVEVRLPLGIGMGAKQSISVSHLPDAGPIDPEKGLIDAEILERKNKPSNMIRTYLDPHVSQTIAGCGAPLKKLSNEYRREENSLSLEQFTIMTDLQILLLGL